MTKRSLAEKTATKEEFWEKTLAHFTVLNRSVITGTSRSTASALDCCHSYLQKVRNAVALVLLKEQVKVIEALKCSQVGIYVLSFDETEQRMRVNGLISTYHLFMVAASLVWQTSASEPTEIYPLTVRPAVIENTTAESMWAALMDRSPAKLADLKKKCQVLVLVLSTDAHKANVRLGRHFKLQTRLEVTDTDNTQLDGVLCVTTLCLMHQTFLIMSFLLRMLSSLRVSLFISTVLMHRVKHWRHFRKLARQHIASNFEIVYGRDRMNTEKYDGIYALLSLAKQLKEPVGDADDAHAESVKAKRRELACFVCESEFQHGRLVKWKHACGPGCCASKEESIQRLYELLDANFFDQVPDVPATNKWTKVSPALSWWTLVVCLGSATSMRTVAEKWRAHQPDSHRLPPTDIGDCLAGPLDEDSWERREALRFRKASIFLEDPLTPMRLLAASVVLQPVMKIMHNCFDLASREKNHNILEFALPRTSCD